MRDKLHKFIDTIEGSLDAWYYSRYGVERNRQPVSSEDMQHFTNAFSDRGSMFFCIDDAKAMDSISNDIEKRSTEYEQNTTTH